MSEQENMTIGQRAAEEIKKRVSENGHSFLRERALLDLEESTYNGWEKGKYNPAAYYLQQMALNGYDVHYILTGERKNSHG